jgi:hypothetical protein
MEFYLQLESPDCPVTPAERKLLLGDMEWSAFTVICRIVADFKFNLADAAARLDELSGFSRLKDVLERHFFQRSRFLRKFRVLRDARKVLSAIRFKHLPEFRALDRNDMARRDRFVAFIRGAQGNTAVAKELEDFVALQCGVAKRADKVEAVLKDTDRKLSQVFHEMEEVNADFDVLQDMDQHVGEFSRAELDELRCLLGLYGMDAAKRLPCGLVQSKYVEQRQGVWNAVRLRDQSTVRRRVAERAETRYGLILNEITKDEASN